MKTAIKHIIRAPKALFLFLATCSEKGLRKFRPYYTHGGLSLCRQMACFQITKVWHNRILTKSEPQKYQLSSSQSQRLLGKCKHQPLISIVTPVYKVDAKWLDLCVRSVVNQHYPNWELILVDDGSQRQDLTDLIEAWCLKDQRIKSAFLKENRGIAGATNAGFEQACGEFIGILDHDDELTPDALVWVVWTYNQHPKAKWFYSDEDLITTRGVCHSPFYKPDYSPENLLSRNFICHFRVYAADVLRQIGGKRTGFDGAQDHDLALRFSEAVKPDQIVHIPRVLYHWRTIRTSAATSIQAKPKASMAGVRAVSEALQRRGVKASVTSHPLSPTLYCIEFNARQHPEVVIVVSLRSGGQSLDACLSSIDRHTTYPNYQVFVIDDSPKDSVGLTSFIEIKRSTPTKTLKVDKTCSRSEKLNRAVGSIDADLFVFMDDDIQITTPNWLDQLVGTMQMDETIGAVGSLLISPKGKVVHAGVILGVKDGVGLACRNMNSRLPGDGGRMHSIQEYSALTGEMLCVSRRAFDAIGGFNPKWYPDAYRDIDLCLRMKAQGFRCVYNPMVKAIWCRTNLLSENSENKYYLTQLRQDYPDLFCNDPFYNPNLSLDNEWFLGYRDFPVEQQVPELKV